jgi:hypothetical protein
MESSLKHFNDWMNSISPQWRIAAACMGIFISILLLLLAAIGGFAMVIMTVVVIWVLSYLFLLPNLCLIVCLRRGWRFRLAHFGIILAYVIPVAGVFLFPEVKELCLVFYLIPIAAACHFFYLTFTWQEQRPDRAWKIMKFSSVFLVMAAICTYVWDDRVAGKLYSYSDDISLGFLLPGTWVSSPVVSVDSIDLARSVGDSHEIKKGWSVAGLWGLWLLFVSASMLISITLSWLRWIPGRLKHRLSAAT